MSDRSQVAAGLPVLRAVGVKGTSFPPLKIKEVRDGIITIHEIPDPRQKWIAEYLAAVSQSRGQHFMQPNHFVKHLSSFMATTYDSSLF